MKRSLLISVSVASLFIGAPALAQSNQSTTNQDGRNSIAFTNQTGSSSGSATITQNGADNGANALQSGARNSASINQNGNDIAPTNDYSNAANRAVPVADANYISNFANVDQKGNDGQAGVSQTGANKASVAQGLGGSANRGFITQSNSGLYADRNTATTIQNGSDGFSSTRQAGNKNTADVTQDATSANAFSIVDQDGTNNDADVAQSGNGAESYVTQRAQDNEATVIQNGDSFSSIDQQASDNEATVNQNGDFNRSEVTQNNRNEASVDQQGNDNRSLVQQTASNALVEIDQIQNAGTSNGDYSNNSEVIQNASASARVSQVGDENFSRVVQNGDDLRSRGPRSDSFGADVSQRGRRNASYVTQGGFENYAVVEQGEGNGSTAGGINGPVNDSYSMISQNGTKLVTEVTQAADSNYSEVSQSGADNLVSVGQYSADNNSYVVQSGVQNVTVVSQSGSTGNTAWVNQTGTLNSALVQQ